jgi:signal transduction histidine kinase
MGTRVLGLRGQIIGGIVILAVAATGIMGILSLKVIEQKVLYSKIREAEALGDLFRLSGVEKPDAIKDLAELTREAGRITNYEILDRKGAILFKSTPGNLAHVSVDSGRLIIQRRGMTLRHAGETSLNPVFGEFNVQVALVSGVKVNYSISLDGLRDELHSIRRFIFYFSLLACVVIIGFGIYILSITVVMPIRKLERTARSIASGDLAVRADEGKEGKGYDEIGSLARSFNLMARSVEEKVLSIERVNRDLLSAQERLIMTEKLATAGRFAAGIAHEIGNPLGAVQGYLEILGKGDVEESESAEIIERMAGEISRINVIVEDFLDMSRPSNAEKSTADVNKVLEETISIMKAHKGFGGVQCELKEAPGLPMARIAPPKLKQVFMNLLLNSAEAMEGKGIIKIETNMREAESRLDSPGRRSTDVKRVFSFNDEEEKLVEPAAATKTVVISFSDDGPGISEDGRKKIFDPFFTTKETGKGTGLGLFISEGIVEAYRGKISVRSELGEGTTFEVILEATEGE